MFEMFKEFTAWEIIKMVLGAIVVTPICWALISFIFLFGGYPV